MLLAYGKDHRLLGMASQLLGSNEMNQLINQAHFKIPGDNVAFPWHQDSENRGYGKPGWKDVNGRGSFVQQAIAIDDVTEENGPLKFIPGSCKLGHLGLLSRSEEECRTLFNPDDAVTGIMNAGSVGSVQSLCHSRQRTEPLAKTAACFYKRVMLTRAPTQEPISAGALAGS